VNFRAGNTVQQEMKSFELKQMSLNTNFNSNVRSKYSGLIPLVLFSLYSNYFTIWKCSTFANFRKI